MRDHRLIEKPLDQVTATDIAGLTEHGGAYESVTLEFKRELPGRDGRPDPWLAGGDFASYARDRIFREIVAFANAQGGTLVLGVDETEDRPPRASVVMPIPRVHELAARLEDAARACIEPPLPSLHVRGVITEGDAGVVLFRTVASPFGPHRVTGNGHAFVRRGTSSVQMTMREIQDLTLDLARGADRLDALFSERTEGFAKWLDEVSITDSVGCRITAAPLAPLPRRVRMADRIDDMPFNARFRASLAGQRVELQVPVANFRIRPILRGVRRDSEDDRFAFRLEVLDSGIIDFWVRRSHERDAHLHIGSVLGACLSVLRIADSLRGVSAAPEWEFGVELELNGFGHRAAGLIIPHALRPTLPSLRLQLFGGTMDIQQAPIVFPRVAFRSRTEEEQILNLVVRDLLDAGGLSEEAPPLRLLD